MLFEEKLIHPNKDNKIIFLSFSFSKNKAISFAPPQNVLCQKNLLDKLSRGIKLNLPEPRNTTCKIVSRCDVIGMNFNWLSSDRGSFTW